MRENIILHLKNQHILVLGLAKSGSSVAKLLLHLGAIVTINERKERSECQGVEELEAKGATVICGGHPLSLFDKNIAFIVKNPGIPYDIPFLQEADRRGVPVMTEVEIAYLISKAPIIGITGTNGKTTTTTLVYEMLNDGEHQPVIAGNIGTVMTDVAAEARENQIIVAELSSFQLLGTYQFRPRISLLLNLYDAHLNYHHSREHYIQSKAKIFQNQTKDDVAVLNADQEEVAHFASSVQSRVVWFSLHQPVNRGCYVQDQMIRSIDEQGFVQDIIPVREITLLGRHNLQNAIAAIAVAREAGASVDRIRHVLRTFKGIRHRLEFVRERNGVTYYNDSKATNAQATSMALQAFEQNVILIAGGLDRGEDFMELSELFHTRLKAIVAYGQIAKKITELAKEAGVKEIELVDNVNEAVFTASTIAQEGDVVLLSPAAASWDQFSSFEERGDMFTQSVHKLR